MGGVTLQVEEMLSFPIISQLPHSILSSSSHISSWFVIVYGMYVQVYGVQFETQGPAGVLCCGVAAAAIANY